MFKLIGLIVAAIPVILFLKTLLRGRLKKSQAFAEFQKQVDYVVWVILFLIACAVLYGLASLILGWR